jgi:hypothetical protein
MRKASTSPVRYAPKFYSTQKPDFISEGVNDMDINRAGSGLKQRRASWMEKATDEQYRR